jgi:hypothetical protein
MTLFLHPFFHAIGDLWSWFTSGQNATACGILIALLVNIVTVAVLVRTLRAVNRQARAADRQAEAAEAQATVARKQTEVLEQQRMATERAANAAEEQAIAARSATAVADAQRIAAEKGVEAARIQSELTRHEMLARLRPLLVVATRAPQNAGLPDLVYVENHGEGVALEVRVIARRPGATGSIGIAHNILGPSQSALVGADLRDVKREGIQASYESQDGRHFVTVVEPSDSGFLRQNTFEIDERGGWLGQFKIPEVG